MNTGLVLSLVTWLSKAIVNGKQAKCEGKRTKDYCSFKTTALKNLHQNL
jgi:hypothetical protein